jgi:hypothetical protein
MVEEVEEFRSEFQAHSIIRSKLRAFEDCEIKVVDSRRSKGWIGTWFGTETPLKCSVGNRGREAGRVEPLCNVSASRFLVASGDNVRAYVSDAYVGLLQRG